MSDRPTPRQPIDYRTAYLKMKSALHDRVTGLPAVALLFDRLRSMLETRKTIGVLHVEVADLELVESLYGWQVFDGIVARTARALRETVGHELPPSALIALNGVAGDRFVLFVPADADGVEPEGRLLAELGRAIEKKVETAFDVDALAGLNPGLHVRVGHALLAQNPFYRFERCVYAAVEEARGRHARRQRDRELSWGDELRSIIRGGSIRTLFQPIVELSTRRLVGHEALARGPGDSMFETPRAMFALSERMGLCGELDCLCFEAALAASGRLEERGKLFVNLRLESFNEGEAVSDRLRVALERHGLEPLDLVLEVSERAAGRDPEPFVERLCGFKREGFRVALDDVGTGRAGLRAVERIAPDYLKVDPCLVRNLHESLMQQEVLATLVGLAERVGGAVIGEGIESEAEAEALARGGARFGQGHLFAPPAEPRVTRLRRAERGAGREH